MNHEEKLPPYSTANDLRKLLVIVVQEITSVEMAHSRIAISVSVNSDTLPTLFPDYNPSVDMVKLASRELLLHVVSSGCYYYAKCLYDHIFPWKSEKKYQHQISIVCDRSEVGNVTRIYTIDNLLASI